MTGALGRVGGFLAHDVRWTRGLAWFCLVLAVAESLVAGALLAGGDDLWGFAMVGGICSALVMLPLLRRDATVFSLWGPVALVVTLGTGVRGLAMATGYPDPEVISEKFVRGHSFGGLTWSAVVTVLSVALIVAGYLLARRRTWRSRRWTHVLWGHASTVVTGRRVAMVVTGYAVVGAVATLLYLRAVGGLGSSISDRRTVYRAGGDFQSYGHWEFLARAGVVALMVCVAWLLLRGGRLRVLDYILLCVLTLNAFAINIITTTRTDVLYVTLGLLMLVRLVRGRISLPASVAAGLLVVVAIGLLSNMRAGLAPEAEEDSSTSTSSSSSSSSSSSGDRSGSSTDDGGGSEPPGGDRSGSSTDDAGGPAPVSSGLSSGVLNRNGYDLSKTLVIIDAVPQELPYAYGSTMARYVLAPVPRALWPAKPAISEGVTIGREIYGLEHTGIPPGVTAELVWNFGRPLALLLSLAVGLVLGLVDSWALTWPRTSIGALVVSAVVVLPLGKAVMGVSLGQASSMTAQTLVLVAPLLLAARGRSTRGPLDGRPSRDAQR